MKQRAQHIAAVLATAPILYGVDLLLRSLNDSGPEEPFYRFLWKSMWEPLTDR
jgi:hypothetical protein